MRSSTIPSKAAYEKRQREILEMEADRSYWLGRMTDPELTAHERLEARVCECLCRARVWELKQGYYDNIL